MKNLVFPKFYALGPILGALTIDLESCFFMFGMDPRSWGHACCFGSGEFPELAIGCYSCCRDSFPAAKSHDWGMECLGSAWQRGAAWDCPSPKHDYETKSQQKTGVQFLTSMIFFNKMLGHTAQNLLHISQE